MPFFPLPGFEPGFFKDKIYQCATTDYVDKFVMVFLLTIFIDANQTNQGSIWLR